LRDEYAADEEDTKPLLEAQEPGIQGIWKFEFVGCCVMCQTVSRCIQEPCIEITARCCRIIFLSKAHFASKWYWAYCYVFWIVSFEFIWDLIFVNSLWMNWCMTLLH
jgi:hypothetical protein